MRSDVSPAAAGENRQDGRAEGGKENRRTGGGGSAWPAQQNRDDDGRHIFINPPQPSPGVPGKGKACGRRDRNRPTMNASCRSHARTGASPDVTASRGGQHSNP